LDFNFSINCKAASVATTRSVMDVLRENLRAALQAGPPEHLGWVADQKNPSAFGL
jgi:hypothetical protein